MLPYNSKFNPSAWMAIKEARAWYRKISLGLAIDLSSEIKIAVQNVVNGPYQYHIRFLQVRRINLTRFPYAFHFLIDESSASVIFLNFFHIKMDMPYLDRGDPNNELNEP